MTDDRWQRVKALFQATVERPVGERDAFLASAAGDDVQGQGGFWKCGWALGLEPKLGGPKNGAWGEPSGLRHFDEIGSGRLVRKATLAGPVDSIQLAWMSSCTEPSARNVTWVSRWTSPARATVSPVAG